MIVLSLFDGMSCGRIALERAGVPVTKYYASEIDKFAMQVSRANYPDIEQIGSVTEVRAANLPKIDLLIGGSPCQGFSFAGKQLNFEDPRSKLFFEFVRILDEARAINPEIKFFLENVKMKKEYQDVISGLLGVEPVEVNSALVSAQNRVRLYWTNIEGFEMPEDRNINLEDIAEVFEPDVSVCNPFTSVAFTYAPVKNRPLKKIGYFRKDREGRRVYSSKGKASTLCANPSGGPVTDAYLFGEYCEATQLLKGPLRKLTRLENERLQTVPEGYTLSVSPSQATRMLGNGWTVDVVVEFFKHLRPFQYTDLL